MVARQLLETISDRIKGMAHVETVYGESWEMEGKTVIPVASVSYCFGAGAGGVLGSRRGGDAGG